MNADWLRAWRYLHKYALGAALVFGLFAIYRGEKIFPDIESVLPLFLKADANEVLILVAALFFLIVCASFLDLLYQMASLA